MPRHPGGRIKRLNLSSLWGALNTSAACKTDAASGESEPVCRLKQLGLSAAGAKKDLNARLEAHNMGLESQGPYRPVKSKTAVAAKLKGVEAGIGVFKSQKRKNFVRINLKVCPAMCAEQDSAASAMVNQQKTLASTVSPGLSGHCLEMGIDTNSSVYAADLPW